MFRKLTFLGLLSAAATVQAGQNVVVVLDDSGSMNDRMRSNRRQTKMDAAKDALLTVLAGVPPEAKVGVLLLNGRWGGDRWVCPLAAVDMAKVRQAVQRIRAGGSTPLGERMKEGCDALLSLREEEIYGSYKLLIVTDGEATDEKLMERYLPDILSRGVWVDVIGVDMAQDHSLATKVDKYRRADDPESLQIAIAEVLKAESTGDVTHAGQSDFELIAALPDEVATAALKALADAGNHPIGELPPGPAEAPPGVTPEQRPWLPPGRPAPQAPVTTSRLSCTACAGLVLGGVCLVVVILVVVAVAKRPRRF